MTLFVCWVVFPLVLAAICLGCGLLIERAAGRSIQGALLLPVGLTVIVAVGQFATLLDATASLALPLVIVLALIGLVVGWPFPTRRPDRWALAGCLAVFAAFAAPIVLSGEATFAGFIKLDDTASWLGITDRVVNDGYRHSGLAPSSYEAMIDFYLNSDYPVGSFLPLGLVGKLVGQDYIWLYQPYLAFLAAMLAAAIYTLAEPIAKSRPLRALIAAVASQPAILFGYTLLGGAKELFTAALIAAVIALVPPTVRDGSVRGVIPLAFAAAAIISALSFGGIIWLGPAALAVLVVIVRRTASFGVRSAAALVGLIALLLIPATRGLDFLGSSAASTVTDESRLANLFHPLNALQVLGIWPVGDFRLTPDSKLVTYILLAALVGSLVVGLYFAWKKRAWAPLLYIASVGLGALAIAIAGSPWVEAKGYAIASPAFVMFALLGGAALYNTGRRVGGVTIIAVITAGVLWSNALAYHDVNLGPRSQLAELEEINEQIDGEGPTLMTDYQSFGVRYLLRDGDPESVSELRRRVIPRRDGSEVRKGGSADIDELALGGILTYRTLVLRRSPIASRPPSPYILVRQDDYYDVWQRPATPVRRVIEHLSLGERLRSGAPAPCGQVLRMARATPPGGRLVAAIAATPVVVALSGSEHPETWTLGPTPGSLRVTGSGTVETAAVFLESRSYESWVGGSFGGKLTLSVDGERVGAVRNRLNNQGGFELIDEHEINAGQRSVDLDYKEGGLHPGSAARPSFVGPIVFADPGFESKLINVPPSEARSLCGRQLDWIEIVD